jgi:hypothetical protein
MNLLASRKSWLLSPVVFVFSVLLLLFVWSVMEPDALCAAFDHDGRSFVEVLTLPFYALIVPTVWLACPYGGSLKRKVLLSLAVSCVAVMAVCKELDLHIALISSAYPDTVANFRGTPFKMRFLTRGGIPVGAKLMVVSYFVLFFGVFAAMFAAYAVKFVKGVFKFHPVAWTIGCMGASGVMVQLCDRIPAWYRHTIDGGEALPIAAKSMLTALEEGGEMMLAAFALIAILQAHELYGAGGEKYPVECDAL